MNEKTAIEAALRLCRGHYQRAIVLGEARLSGADLRGRAKEYSSRYACSRENLLARVRAAGVPYRVATRAHGRLELVFGAL